MNRLCLFVLASLLMAAAAVHAAPNLYPDPSFETTGAACDARTGQKAATLKVDKSNHWDAMGGQVEVQPFARYRVTEWVRGKLGTGTFLAPYVYGWDSYEWAYAGGHAVQTLNDWTQTEYVFVTPEKSIFLAPLAYMEAGNSEFRADDLVLEKIAEPEQVMAETLAKASPNDNERKLIVRWLVAKGDIAGATKIMEASGGLTRADAATVIAKAITDPAKRLTYLIQVVADGGPTYFEGMKRFNEMSGDLTPQQRLMVAVEALKQNPNDDRAGRSVQMVLTGGKVTDPSASVSEAFAQLQAQRASLQTAAAVAPAGSPGAKALQDALAKLDQTLAALQAQKDALGSCTVKLAGKAIAPEAFNLVIPDKATPQEAYAARELRRHLELVTGKVYAIKSESENGAGNGFFIGNTRKAAAAGVKCAALGLEGIQLKLTGSSLILAGNQRGCLYATYVFLEDYLGCRWFTPDCATWRKRGTINITSLDRRFIPPLEFRAGDYPIAHDGTFAARLRLNGNNHQMSDEQGGRKGVHSLAHTFAWLLPPEKYFATHPEYFSLVGGKRQSGYAQPCLTNPEVLEIVIAGVRQAIKDNPNMKVFAVSQNDCDNHCECADCQKIADAEGSQMGPLLRFVNAVADDIARDYPDVAIETLAYQYTRKPTKLTKPRPNVIITLCSIECCFIHPLGEDEFNKTFADDIRGWHKICDRLWIWDYVINYAHSVCPFPNLRVLKPNINFFIANGVKGIYEESCYYTEGSELQELRNYIMAKCLWDPKYDDKEATREFCAAYYGAAAPQIEAYLKLIHESVQQAPNVHVQIYTHPRQYVFPEALRQANVLFDQAEAAVAGDALLLRRVQTARLPILYAQIVLNSSGAFVEKDGKLVQQEGHDVSSLLDRFTAIALENKVTKVREGGTNSDTEAWLASVPRQSRELKIETIQNADLRVEVLPACGGRIWRLTHLPSGTPLMHLGGTATALAPAEGGYEEYSQGDYRSAGWNELFYVNTQSERLLQIRGQLRNGLALSRRFELAPDRPLLTITSSLENISKEPVQARLRAHPEFAVSSTEKASVIVSGADGKQTTIDLANPKDPTIERDQWLRDTDMPAGKWTLVDAGTGLSVVNTFNRDDVGVVLLNRAGHQSRVNLELFGNETTLKPGQSVQLRQSYEIVKK